MMTESIAPIQKETVGLRNEVLLLAETMKHSFQKLDFMGNRETLIKAYEKQLSLS